jgi:transposase
VADPRLHRDSGSPARCRREKKADGTGGQEDQAFGRSRGGFGTKIHGAVSGLGLPVKLILTGGQAADVTQAKNLLAGLPATVVIGDKGYDSQDVVNHIRTRGAEPVIPSRANAKEPREYDRERYKDRNLVERFWHKVKQHRRVATRYEKTARNFMGFLLVASIMVLLR